MDYTFWADISACIFIASGISLAGLMFYIAFRL